MESSVTLVLVTGLVSIVSVLAGGIVQHWLDMRKIKTQISQHPRRILYDKQTEFFDKVIPVLDELNGYITRIDVWLGETGEDARKEVGKAAENSLCVTRFHELVEQYYLYLPKELLDEANRLWWECFALRELPTVEKTYKSINLLFKLQNTIRRFVGVEELSDELLKAFGRRAEQRSKGGGEAY